MGIDSALLDTVLGQLGLHHPPPVDRAGLDALYRAWCHHIPFDNARKLIALRSGGALPGMDPVEFLESWLEHGTGDTCWPSCNALFAVVTACGFDAQRVTASMADLAEPNHGTILVRLSGRDYLIDTAMLLNRAIRLDPDVTVVDADPLRPVEYETVDGSIRIWIEFLRMTGGVSLPCRLMTRGVDGQLFRNAYEASRTKGPFNRYLIAARNQADRVDSFDGGRQITRHRDGRRTVIDHDAESLRTALVNTVGFSADFVERWESSGALRASLQDPSGDGPPMPLLPPSRRG